MDYHYEVMLMCMIYYYEVMLTCMTYHYEVMRFFILNKFVLLKV